MPKFDRESGRWLGKCLQAFDSSQPIRCPASTPPNHPLPKLGLDNPVCLALASPLAAIALTHSEAIGHHPPRSIPLDDIRRGPGSGVGSGSSSAIVRRFCISPSWSGVSDSDRRMSWYGHCHGIEILHDHVGILYCSCVGGTMRRTTATQGTSTAPGPASMHFLSIRSARIAEPTKGRLLPLRH
jgi:hypothetical protein